MSAHGIERLGDLRGRDTLGIGEIDYLNASLGKFLLTEVRITSKLITQSLTLLKNVSQLFGILLPRCHFYSNRSLSHVGKVTGIIVELGSFAD